MEKKGDSMHTAFFACMLLFNTAPIAEGPDEKVLITSYWQYLNAILDADANQPSVDEGKFSRQPLKNYPFDRLYHLNANGLRRAAEEGVEVALRTGRMREAEEIFRQVQANVQRALMYYPLVAEDKSAASAIMTLSASPSRHPAMREYLVRRMAPGLCSQSLFASWLQEQALRYPKDVEERLLRMAGNPAEQAVVQQTAIAACFAHFRRRYTQILKKDPALMEYAAGLKEPLCPELLQQPAAPEPAGILKADLNRVHLSLSEFVKGLIRLQEPGSTRPPAVQEQARLYIRKTLDSFPLHDAAELGKAAGLQSAGPEKTPAPSAGNKPPRQTAQPAPESPPVS
jgi:hypothetical protein